MSATQTPIRLPAVRGLTGVGRSTIYRPEREDLFVGRVRLSQRATALGSARRCWRGSRTDRAALPATRNGCDRMLGFIVTAIRR
jgi:predicted DNA-binding transcriptional regulator AlpA